MHFPTGVGQMLTEPPVDVRAAGSRAAMFTLMRGASFYGAAAGGFPRGSVQAMPQLQRFRPPASGNSPQDVALVQLYVSQPGLFRRRLERMFIPRPAPGR